MRTGCFRMTSWPRQKSAGDRIVEGHAETVEEKGDGCIGIWRRWTGGVKQVFWRDLEQR
jgi:hypothetical protein